MSIGNTLHPSLASGPFQPEDYEAVLADMDGVLILGKQAAPGAARRIPIIKSAPACSGLS